MTTENSEFGRISADLTADPYAPLRTSATPGALVGEGSTGIPHGGNDSTSAMRQRTQPSKSARQVGQNPSSVSPSGDSGRGSRTITGPTPVPPRESKSAPPTGSKFTQRRKSRRKKRLQEKRKRQLAREAWRNTGVGWRVFPRTLLGIIVSILMFATGAGVAGAVLFAYYEARVSESENRIAEFSTELDRRVSEGVESIEAASAAADQRLSSVLGQYGDLLQNEQGLPGVAGQADPSLALVETRGLDGATSVGTATAVGRTDEGTILVTAFSVVEASRAEPGPEIFLRRGNDRWGARLLSWDEEIGLAVLVSDADLPAAPFADLGGLGVLTGSPVFSLSSLNGSVSPGTVVAVTQDGFRHTGVTDADFQGGPIVGKDGKIIGFSNDNYAPSGIPGGNVPWSPTVVQMCETLLTCANAGATPR